jgi:hypothetical protein
MRRRRNDLWEKPWVIIATVVGIIAVLAIALVFFMGSGTQAGQQPSSHGQVPAVTKSPAPQNPAVLTTGIAPESIKTPVPVSVPDTGVFVKVSYIGGFGGTYGVDGVLQNVRSSGDRVFAIEKATGTISATFHKEDGSSRHDLTIEIWKDGKVQKFGKNTTSFGEVSLTYQL